MKKEYTVTVECCAYCPALNKNKYHPFCCRYIKSIKNTLSIPEWCQLKEELITQDVAWELLESCKNVRFIINCDPDLHYLKKEPWWRMLNKAIENAKITTQV